MENTKRNLSIIVALLAISGCAAKSIKPGAEVVMLGSEKPSGNCSFVGEVTGGQGNAWTSDITSAENLLIGSRNDLRNNAFLLGANYVQVSGANSYVSGGTMALIGDAYKCGV